MKATIENMKSQIEINNMVNVVFGNGRRATFMYYPGEEGWVVQGMGTLGSDEKLQSILSQYETKTGKEAVIII